MVTSVEKMEKQSVGWKNDHSCGKNGKNPKFLIC